MQEENKILELIDKLIANKATSSEKEELFQLINSEKNNDQIDAWLKNKWDNTALKNLNIDSESILNKIHQQIKESKASSTVPTNKKSNIRRIVQSSLKYAAIIVIACGIEWFIIAQTKSGNDYKALNQTVQYNEIAVPIGSKSFVVLADSTKVWLNAGAKLRYPSNFQKNSREVYLEGEAFFDVSKNKDLPFFVNMTGMNIKVLGTQFNVKAYSDEKSIETTLVEGSIEVVGLKSDKKDENNLQLKPGQKLILFKDDSKILNAEVITLHDTGAETAWMEDKLIFHKERFENVKIKLERWYGVTIDIKDQDILDYRFSGTFDEETFEQALNAMKKAAKFDYQIKKKHVIIKRN